MAACLLVQLVVLSLILLAPPSLGLVKSLPLALFVRIFVWGMAVDLGQAFGGSRLVGRRPRACVAVLVLAVAAAAAFFWRPIIAEYHFYRGLCLERSNRMTAGKIHLARAKMLSGGFGFRDRQIEKSMILKEGLINIHHKHGRINRSLFLQ